MAELKEELTKRGLSTVGLKRYLIERLAQNEVWIGKRGIKQDRICLVAYIIIIVF